MIQDGTAMLGRQLLRLRHAPALPILTQGMSVALLLFFGYVLGGALAMPAEEYRAFLVPGMLAALGANGIMTGMFTAAQDLHRGVTDRLRTLPVSRAAVPLGQVAADLLVTAAGLVPLLLVGFAMGWRIEGGLPSALGALGILLLFRCACMWVGILLGVASQSEEAAGQLGSSTFLLPMLSTAYLPTDGLPGWLRTVAEWNPISAVATAVRHLFSPKLSASLEQGGAPISPIPDGAWPVAHPVMGALGWCALLIGVCAPLAVRRYARVGG